MSMVKKILRSGITTLVLAVLAIGFIGFGGINTIQAAPRVVSEYFGAEVVMANIQTAITEDGTVVEGSDKLLQNWPKNEKFAIGKVFDEKLAVRNTGKANDGGIAEYVRVTVRKYWTDTEGNELDAKVTGLKPEHIDLHFVEGNGWTIDADSSTPERTVLYYSGIIEPGADSTPFADKLSISSEVATAIDPEGEFEYEAVVFHIDAEVDAVQTHNASDAKGSAWGKSL